MTESVFVVEWDDVSLQGCTTVHRTREGAEARFLTIARGDEEWSDADDAWRVEDHDGDWEFTGESNSVSLVAARIEE